MLFLRKNLHSLKQLDEKRRDNRKRKSVDKSLSDNEHEQVTPSVSEKKHKSITIMNYNDGNIFFDFHPKVFRRFVKVKRQNNSFTFIS